MRKYFLFLIIMALISALLMIVHNNAPSVFSYLYGWGPIFVISALLFHSKISSNRLVLLNIIFFFLYALILPKIFWIEMNDWYYFRQFTILSGITVAVTIFIWLRNDNNLFIWYNLAKMGLIFIIVTCLITIFASMINPMVIRASYSSGKDGIENFMFFRRMGIGSYGFITSITLLFPTLIYLYKQKKSKVMRPNIILGTIIIIYITLLQAQIFANIIVATYIIILSIISIKNFKKHILILAFSIILLLIIPNYYYIELFTFLSSFFDTGSILQDKLLDLTHFVGQDQIFNTGIGTRTVRYPMLWQVFSANPLFGDASYNSIYNNEINVGGHLFWMSRLALWGIFGFVFFIWLLYKDFNEVYSFFNDDFQYYYLLSILAFVVLGLMKNLNFTESFLVLFIIIPGLYLSAENIQIKNLTPKKFK